MLSINPPLAKAWALCSGDVLLFVCLSVYSFIGLLPEKFAKSFRCVIAPGGEWGLIVSTPVHLLVSAFVF